MKSAKQAKHAHMKFVKDERNFVESERFRIKASEDDLYFEIDGMDQSKTNLPHWPNTPKDVNKDLLMQIHVSAVRYADGRQADIYMYNSTFAHDSDCTGTIIYNTVYKVTALARYLDELCLHAAAIECAPYMSAICPCLP